MSDRIRRDTRNRLFERRKLFKINMRLLPWWKGGASDEENKELMDLREHWIARERAKSNGSDVPSQSRRERRVKRRENRRENRRHRREDR